MQQLYLHKGGWYLWYTKLSIDSSEAFKPAAAQYLKRHTYSPGFVYNALVKTILQTCEGSGQLLRRSCNSRGGVRLDVGPGDCAPSEAPAGLCCSRCPMPAEHSALFNLDTFFEIQNVIPIQEI